MKRIIKKIILNMDKIIYRNKYPECQIYLDNECFRNMTAGIIGADINESIKIINEYMTIKGSNILVLGCGKGEEIKVLKEQEPNSITAFDYLDYESEWNEIRDNKTHIFKCDIKDFKSDIKYDLIISKAVMEHIRDLENIFPSIMSHLKIGGYMWADFGSLWYCSTGSHLAETYDHIIMSKQEFLDTVVITTPSGLIYWENDMFSKMSFYEYIFLFNKYLNMEYIAIERQQKTDKHFDKTVKLIFYLGVKEK